MAATNPVLDTILFVDTNVMLDFYRIRKSDISTKYLEQLELCKDRLIVGAQVEMEYKKHRQRVLVEFLAASAPPDWSKLSPPALIADLQAVKMIQKYRTQIMDQRRRVTEKVMKVLNDPTHHDPVYQTLQRLFKNPSPLNLSRGREERFEIRELAEKRFKLGYPPRKSSDTSIGDAINWEWIVKCAADTGKHVVIVTRDTDYGVIYDGHSYLNDWLRQEFSERVSHKRKIVLTDKLSVGLREVHAAVTREMEEEEARILAKIEPAASEDFPLEVENFLRELAGADANGKA
jgi:hypothetical protein